MIAAIRVPRHPIKINILFAQCLCFQLSRLARDDLKIAAVPPRYASNPPLGFSLQPLDANSYSVLALLWHFRLWRYLQGTCHSEDIVGVEVVRRGRGSLA
jgi:hypothetical protein